MSSLEPLSPVAITPMSLPDGAQSPAAGVDPQAAATHWSSSQLLGGRREAHIAHEGTVYRLRLTSLGKLILTK